ncbi:MAG: HmuY family protein [Bacteroidota bacterium]
MRTIICRNVILMAISSTGLISCMKRELPVPLKPKGKETTASVEMTEDYKLQIFYSLRNNTIVGTNKYTAWDLGFETAQEGWRIMLNGAKFKMAIYPVKKKFEEVKITDTTGIASLIDVASGNPDSTAFGDWRNAGKTYIIYKGTDETGKYLGMEKIQILSVDASKYVVRFSAIDGSNEKTLEIAKDEEYNYAFLSFDGGGKTLLIEPPKKEWDIAFTKYTHFYYDLDMRYSVVGCLLNSYNTSAGRDSVTKNFAEIDLQKAASVVLRDEVDAIGFEWKSYDLNTGKFSVDAGKHYIIRSGEEGIYYKLRFIDFYNNGIKGTPKFEYQRL